jgi:hypothetical protein
MDDYHDDDNEQQQKDQPDQHKVCCSEDSESSLRFDMVIMSDHGVTTKRTATTTKTTSPLEDMVRQFQMAVPIRDRRYRGRIYQKTFVGSDAVTILTTLLQNYVDNNNNHTNTRLLSSSSPSTVVITRVQATNIGNYLMKQYHLFEHVTRNEHHILYDDYYFYRFCFLHVEKDDEEEEELETHRDDKTSSSLLLNHLWSSSLLSSSSSSSLFLSSSLRRRIRRHRQEKQHSQRKRRPFSASKDNAFLQQLLKTPHHQQQQQQHVPHQLLLQELSMDDQMNTASLQQEQQQQDSAKQSGLPTRFDEFAALNMMAEDLEMGQQKDNNHDNDDSTLEVTTASTTIPQLKYRQLSYETLNNPALLHEAAVAFELGIPIKTHRFRGRAFKDTFVGSDAVDFLLASGWANTRQGAEAVGNTLMKQFHLFEHVSNKKQPFRDDFYFYRLVPADQRRGIIWEGSSTTDDSFSSIETLTMVESSSKIFRQNQKKSLEEIAIDFQAAVPVEDRRYRLKTYQQCFIARDAVSFLTGGLYVASRIEAVQLGRRLQDELDLFQHVTNQHKFEDEYLFFRFKDPNHLQTRQEKRDDQSLLDTIVNDSIPLRMPLQRLADEFKKNVTTQTHHYRFRKYKRSFVGSDAIDFLVHASLAKTRKDAVLLERELEETLHLFHHVTRDHPFTDDSRLYRYNEEDDDDDHVFSSSATSFCTSQDMLAEIADALRTNVEVKNRRYLHKLYKDCFLGSDAVTYLVKSGYADDRLSAVKLGREVAVQYNIFEHVERDHEFKDQPLFYRFMTTKDKSTVMDIDLLPVLKPLAEKLADGMEVKSHRYHLRVYKDTFTGEEAVSYMVSSGMSKSREEAVTLGKRLKATFQLFEHVTREHDFEDKFLFYRFVPVNMRLLWQDLVVMEHKKVEDDMSSVMENWDRKLAAFGKRATARRLDSSGMLSLSSKIGSVAKLDNLNNLRHRIWLAEFRRLDPRWRILNFFVRVKSI